MSERVRAWLYRFLLAQGPVLLAAGWLTDKQWAWLVGLLAATLGNGLATKNTSTKQQPEA